MAKKDEEKIVLEMADSDFYDEEKIQKKTVRVLAFSLGNENYCIGIEQAKEVIRMPESTRVPNSPPFVAGITNVRGNIVAILDIHYFFGLEKKGKLKDSRVIITDVVGSNVGIMVDGIKDTIDIEEDSIQPPISTLKGNLAEYTKGQVEFGDSILILLDLTKILKSEEIENLRKGR